MPRTAHIVEVLGGPVVLPEPSSSEQLRMRIREGLPFASVEAVLETFSLGRAPMSMILAIPLRTLTRRKAERRLRPEESDRLVRLARILAQAVDVLGSNEKASQWLQRPNRALGGETPLSLLDTDLGSRQVEEVLGRIEHGVYS